MSAITQGLHHLGLTVSNCRRTADFFCQQLGFREVGEKPDYPAVFVSDGSVMLTLWQARDTGPTTAFDRHHNIGLHHFALRVANIPDLHDLHQRLSELPEVSIEFAPEALAGGPAAHMMCLIPDGLRVEFIAVPG
ncbi:VOC family protein [Pseudomaricurvus sp. HS19]|uniref:VOC family protein n=1 Tax=Pseudomaricurvus sp. HS19 TaxID=2692626 RepID=UPI001369F203|nr:VOC family protein [Pseudomaricurvus sp. HS19]MYM64442.1 VOC family protein [Pseudomaricurvus sp. HS19]